MGAERTGELTAAEVLRRYVGAFVEELARSGVRHVSICPGSRSTPLAMLLREHPDIKVWRHLDERSAAFFALGLAKARREPVAVLSTSGTAAVNFAPAVVEARYARVPLVVLTADRPPELRGVGANQTIDQVRLYGSHVKLFVEVALPEASDQSIRYIRALACRAVATALAGGGGPVHLNFPFREPLLPAAEAPLGRDGARATNSEQTAYVAVHEAPRRPERAAIEDLAATLQAAQRPLFVCGPQDDPAFPAAVARLADVLDVPLLADPLSQVRCGGHHHAGVIDAYDAFLRVETSARDPAPDVILRFGATPTSRSLLDYLERHQQCRQILIDEGDGWNDPTLVAGEMLRAHPASLVEALLETCEPRASQTPSTWTAQWQELATRTRAALTARLESTVGLSEPRVLSQLAAVLPEGATLFAGNSMPVRDLDAFFPGGKRALRFLANRGASGIDGVVSTALGVSAATPGPVVLVIGDLSFYHDMNGLLAAKLHQLSATIVLIQNDGGGIFSLLPQAREEHFEELFGGPHGLDFRPAAELYGLAYRPVDSWDAFDAEVSRSLGTEGVTVVEVKTERAANATLHNELWAGVGRALEATSVGARP